MRPSNLYERPNYSADISYLTNTFITEYDISKANISILHQLGYLDEKLYWELYNAERMVRQVYVGNLQKNKEINKALQAGVLGARKLLFEANNIQDNEVLMIKNDAVYIINRDLVNLDFGLIKFVPKNRYTSFFKINNTYSKLEMLYYYSNITKEEVLDIKGIGKNLYLHEGYFIQLLKDIFYTLQNGGAGQALLIMRDIFNKYISLEFPSEYYRRFDSNSSYHMTINTFINTGFSMDSVNDKMRPYIDISYNAEILREIQKIIITIFFNKR